MPRLLPVIAVTATLTGVLALPARAATVAVAVGDAAFAPASVSVTAGETVTWTFGGSLAHSVTADGGAFDSHPGCAGDPAACGDGGETFAHTFTSAGSFAYHCRVHPGMTGVVVVAEPDTTPPAPVTGLAATPADGQVRLRWTNPASDFAAVDVRRLEGGTAPAGPTDGVAVYSGPGTSAIATGLTNGTAYSFAVFARDAAGNHAAAATATGITPVPAVATTLALTLSAGAVTYGTPVTLTGSLRRADTTAAVSGRPIDVYAKRVGATAWQRINRVTTNAAGTVTYRTTPGATGSYLLRYPGDPFFAAVDSPTRGIAVRQRLSVSMSATVIEQGRSAVISATVTPNHAGHRIHLQRLVDGAWTNIAIVPLSATSTARFVVAPRTLGRYTLRVVRPGDADHAHAISLTMTLTVVRRPLRLGMSGADVLAVERRLAALRYDVGAVDGYYSYDTAHAIQAFQKVNALTRNQLVDPPTWTRLFGTPVAPRLRHSYSGRWLEADLTKQVIYVGRAGALERVVDISSGSGEWFTVDGETQRAVTPTGNFRITHRINAWRVSRLGELYRPAYFAAGGYAIHGSRSVPPYPASHGCIRVTIPAMDRLYSLMPVGTPVAVYRS